MARKISILAIAAAGVIHLVLAPQHYEHAPAHAIFFVISGIAEILWAIAFWRRPSSWLYYSGLAVAGGLVVLWVITRFATPPFEHEPAPIDLSGLLCKASELAGMAALISLAFQKQIAGIARQSISRLVASAIALALLSGLFFYGAGFAAEPLFPSLGSHEENHAEMEMDMTMDMGTSQEPAIAESLQVVDAWARPASSSQESALYFTIQNPTAHADRLLGLSTDIAQNAEMHTTSIDANGVASMSPVESVEVPQGGVVQFKPGGLHGMLIGLKRDLKAGDTFPVTLSFDHAGDVLVQVEVKEP